MNGAVGEAIAESPHATPAAVRILKAALLTAFRF